MRNCGNCGTELEFDDEYCTNCGVKQEALEDDYNKFCEACGTEIEKGDSFCTECGALVDNYVDDCTFDSGEDADVGNILEEMCTDQQGDLEQPEIRNKNNNRIVFKAVLTMVFVIMLASLGYFGYHYFKEEPDYSSIAKSVVEPVAEEPVAKEPEVEKSTAEEKTVEEPTVVDTYDESVDYNVYRQILQKYLNEPYQSTYFFADLDGNGIDELFVKTGSSETEYRADIYTIKNGKAEYIDQIEMSHSSINICGDGGVYLFWAHMGYYSLSQILLEQNTIRVAVIIPEIYDASGSYYEVDEYLNQKGIMEYQTEIVGYYTLLEDKVLGVLTTEISVSETVSSNDYYIIPDSNSRYLTRNDLTGLSADDLMLAQNEIYARRGRGFQDTYIQSYFDSQNWYSQIYTPQEFDALGDGIFNDYEYQNILIILEYEAEQGY